VADQRDVLDVLQVHDAEEPSVLLEAPEADPVLDLTRQLPGRMERSAGITPAYACAASLITSRIALRS
jgi:hypothetical protein